ncbi:MAG: S-adenosylmethionine:tRNA ribosyltransferase-isomerase [Paludibacteraceae bacterium]|nr:S-adenosylmethionine:tRNA ribosyltransferase-isomerase [Paludibacteraceae bacterium]
MLQDTQHIKIEDYNYPLQDERIAKFPLEKRDASKLLLNKNGELSEYHFYDLPELLPADSLLVFNNTKVIQARLIFTKETGAQIEVFCLEPYSPNDYVLSFQQTRACEWKCMVGNSKKWKAGKIQTSLQLNNGKDVLLEAERISTDNNTHIIRFTWEDPSLTFADILDKVGELPIPPYLHRHTCERDKETYQTVYSKIKGSVAAPTAGLHFTPEVLAALPAKGIELEELTLHVGAGTFQPVKSEEIKEHTMHSEVISVKQETIEHLIRKTGRVVAVGTTSVRTLESLYYIGLYLQAHPDADAHELSVQQWTPYQTNSELTTEQALSNILSYLKKNNKDKLQTATQIIIAPGYKFKVVNAIITNFHQPKSTLLLLISAYLKSNWREMYDYALAHDFRFLSYGDSSLLMM